MIYEKHKWYVLAYFVAIFIWAIIADIRGGSSIPEFVFLGSMILWFVLFEIFKWGRKND